MGVAILDQLIWISSMSFGVLASWYFLSIKLNLLEVDLVQLVLAGLISMCNEGSGDVLKFKMLMTMLTGVSTSGDSSNTPLTLRALACLYTIIIILLFIYYIIFLAQWTSWTEWSMMGASVCRKVLKVYRQELPAAYKWEMLRGEGREKQELQGQR